MYEVAFSNRFKKDLVKCKRRGLDLMMIHEAVTILKNTGTLPARYKVHALAGKFTGCRECHITPDWLMVWMQDDKKLTLLFTNTGTHSDLFK